jgi:hypothetical protein
MCKCSKDDPAILDAENVLRFVKNDQIVFDETQNKFRALPGPNGEPWTFSFSETGENAGLSVDHLERINQSHSLQSTFQNCRAYYTEAFGEAYFSKRSLLKLAIMVVRTNGLGITNTPTNNNGKPRPHHCDIWPSDGQNNFVGNQHSELVRAYEVEINNKPSTGPDL